MNCKDKNYVLFVQFPASVKNKGTNPDFDQNHRIEYLSIIMNRKNIFLT